MRIDYYDYTKRLAHDDAVFKYSRTARALKDEPGNFETILAKMSAERNSKPDVNVLEAAKIYLRAKDMTTRDNLLAEAAQKYVWAKDISGRYDFVLANAASNIKA